MPEETQTLTGGVSVTIPSNIINGFGGAYFDIITDHTINIQNQITDNYLENNTAIQDHISHSPITVSVSGIAALLKYVPKDSIRDIEIEKAIKQTKLSAEDKLYKLTSILPPVSNAMQLARNVYDYAEASVKRYTAIYENLKNKHDNLPVFSDTKPEINNRLKEVFQNLLELRNSNTAFTVETPFGKFENMYIQALSFKQGNQNFIGDISITFKELRFGGVETTVADEKVMAKYNAYARTEQENHGKVRGKTSILYDIIYSKNKN